MLVQQEEEREAAARRRAQEEYQRWRAAENERRYHLGLGPYVSGESDDSSDEGWVSDDSFF